MNSIDSSDARGAAGAEPTAVSSDAACSSRRSETLDSGEKTALLRLLRVGGIGPGRLRLLRAHFGCAKAALAAEIGDFAAAIGATEQEAACLLAEAHCAAPKVEEELAELARLKARLVARGDADFPAILLPTPDPPELLFVQGTLDAGPEPAVAIVGSRRATPYGRVHAGRLGAELAERGITVVSGGARGIDAEAHRGALRAGGRTIAVLASGLAHPYPSEHAPLFGSIVDGGGAVLTEQPTFVGPRPDLFPRRNRIIAGLALVTIVVEAANRSGALLTARLAVEDLSRDAGCMPGSIDSPWSAGCHRAIREGWAALVTSADDVCEMLLAARSLVEAAGGCAAAAIDRSPRTKRRAQPAVEERERAARPRASTHLGSEVRAISRDAEGLLEAIRTMGRGGLDELEDFLASGGCVGPSRGTGNGTGTGPSAGPGTGPSHAWTVPRIAAAALELEVAGLVRRDCEGAWVADAAAVRARPREGPE